MSALPNSHLEYYRQHGIAPVKYDLSNLEAHFQRRESLYNKLGLLPIAFKNTNVLEIAAGTGHNSLYVSQLNPSTLTLLEPNETGIQHIQEAYKSLDAPHTKPNLITKMLEDYQPDTGFDIVLCENWLGISEHELNLLKKIATFVNHKGVLIITTVSPIGIVPNLLRRYLSNCISSVHDSFESRTKALVHAFSSHLNTLAHMTRDHIDWVQDNMLNPAYYNLCLSVPRVLEQLGNSFEVINTSPSYCEDWRWFKSLYAENRQSNEHFINQYWKKAHNFIDYRQEAFTHHPHSNLVLEKSAIRLSNLISDDESLRKDNQRIKDYKIKIKQELATFTSLLPTSLTDTIEALKESEDILGSDEITTNHVSDMKNFKRLFGRETGYISLLKV